MIRRSSAPPYHLKLYSAYGGEVYDEFLFAVYLTELVGELLIIGAYAAGAAAYCLAGEVEVLADMSHIYEDYLLSVSGVSPLGAVHDGAPEECDGAVADENLLEGCVAYDLFHVVAVLSHKEKLMGLGEIAVDRSLETLDIHAGEICLKGVTSACRRNCTECGCLAGAVISYALGVVEQIGQLLEGNRGLFVKTLALSLLKGSCQAVVLERAFFRGSTFYSAA